MNKLREEFARRCDGYWELLATAVGMPESVTKTVAALSTEELSKEVYHRDWLVGERVEALAAWNPRLLAELAQTWPRPHQGSFPLWLDAWRTSLRHLKALNAIQPHEIEAPELSREVDVLWGQLKEESVSWSGLLSALRQKPILDINLIRKLSRLPLDTPYPSLAELLESPTAMLRLLRGKTSALPSEVQDFLMSAGQSCLQGELKRMPYVAKKWSVRPDGKSILATAPSTPPYPLLGLTPLRGNMSEAPLILELCKEISPESCDSLGAGLEQTVSQISNPRDIANTMYVLVTDWTVP